MAAAELPPQLPNNASSSSSSMAAIMLHQHQHQQQQPQPQQQLWPPAPDQRDAYISWLRAEFAAANAIIDTMCHHLRSIGSHGDYDHFFSSLQRRRHSWTPSLYMQQFFSVAEIVNSLQQVASWKHRHGASHSPAQQQPPVSLVRNSTEASPLCDLTHDQASQQIRLDHTLPPADTHLSSDCCNSSEELGPSSSSSSSSAATVVSAAETNHCGDGMENADGDEASEAHSSVMKSQDSDGRLSDEGAAAANCSSEEVREMMSEKQNDDEPLKNSGDSTTETSASTGLQVLLKDLSMGVEGKDERVALIKRSMQFQCSEHEDGHMINNGESAELCENVLSTMEISHLVELINQLQEAGIRGELGGSFCKRSSDHMPDILQFGNKHRNASSEKNDIRPIPKFMQSIINWLTRCGILLPGNKRPDLCVVSIFDEGDFDAPNTDQCAWEKPLCILSLMGDCTMIFGHSIASDQKGSCKGPFQVVIPAGSALLLQENFTGILQKAVPVSANRRITIALGKATSTLTNKGRNKWAGSAHNVYNGNKQAVITQIAGMAPLHPTTLMPHLLQQTPLPPMFPNSPNGLMNPYMAHPGVINPGWSALPRVPRVNNPGTGVFFPSSEPHGASSWQSGVIVVSSFSQKNGPLLEVRRASHSKKGEKHSNQFSSNHQARIKVSLDLIAPKKKTSKHPSAAVAPCQDIEGAENGKLQQNKATAVET